MRSLLAIGFFLVCSIGWGQVTSSMTKTLQDIRHEIEVRSELQHKRVRAYTARFNVPMDFYDALGNHVTLVDVENSGFPVYYTTLNAGAALTTRATSLRQGGSLGINMQGRGIRIGVWDDGKVKGHVEFGQRLLSQQGNVFSRHATHVTGTIMASGVDANARGMAPMATATTMDFNNDLPEMIAQASSPQSSLLFSNHSYSVLLGYYRNESGTWSWAGDTQISAVEDYRFGFYNQKAYYIDQIAYYAPHYTIVWSAGNERSDSGDGVYHADGNNGAGYDCINPEGSAKNNITIGAVEKVLNYTGPGSVSMSTFSSWGPTDDGRIKPDLVAAGVSVYSTSVNGSLDAYAAFSGTSMSAPNATGSLALLQELYHDLHNQYMRSATLKALAIHTAREAGPFNGPDYSFGWGLLDVETAAGVLLNESREGVEILEQQLMSGQVFEHSFQAKENTKVTATIVWTDLPGTSPTPQVDPVQLMLVNDLDIRITDTSGGQEMPWVLNPAVPSSAAGKGDNIRDNVEKIEFVASTDQTYTLRVSHKGTLTTGAQHYSVILTYTPVVTQKTTCYWIGGSGDWNDPAHWSLSSGGVSASLVPDEMYHVVFDENSFSSDNPVVSLSADAACASLSWRAKRETSFNFAGHNLQVEGSLIVLSDSLTTSAGTIEFVGGSSGEHAMVFNGADFSLAEITVNGSTASTWIVNGTLKVESLHLVSGNLLAGDVNATINTFTAEGGTLDLTNSFITGLTSCAISSGVVLQSSGATVQLAGDGTAVATLERIQFEGTVNTTAAQTILNGGAFIDHLVVTGDVELNGNNSFEAMTVSPGASITLQEGSTQTLSTHTVIQADALNRTTITTSGDNATMLFSDHVKLCFDFLDIEGVDVAGSGTINAGSGSTLINAANWTTGDCDDALFADFDVAFNCEGALTMFTDRSEGNIVSWEWNFGDIASAVNISDRQHPYHTYISTGVFTVSLTITDGVSSATVSKDIEVVSNDLPSNSIILANDKLYVATEASTYQWFRNDESLAGETTRWLNYDGIPGVYFVLTKNEYCNRPSTPYIVTGVNSTERYHNISTYPNPAVDWLTIRVSQSDLPTEIIIRNMLGQALFTGMVIEEETRIPVAHLPGGLYLLTIPSRPSYQTKVLIQH